MSYFNNMRLTAKIYLLVAILMIGLILSAIFSYVAVERYKDALNLTKKVIIGKTFQGFLTPPTFSSREAIRLAASVELAQTPQEVQDFYNDWQNWKQQYRESVEFAKANLAETDIKRTLLGPLDSLMQKVISTWDNTFWPAAQAGNHEEMRKILTTNFTQLYKEIRPLALKIIEEENSLQNSRLKEEEQTSASAEEAGKSSLWISLIVVIAGLIISVIVASSIHARLKEIVGGISQVSREISGQIDSQGSNVSQLSTSVHETTTSMDELNASFQHTESLAAESSGRAKNALKHSDEGVSLTNEMLEGLTLHKEKVSAIVEQIARLSEITHQIHNVAAATSNLTNQTNILALNAAVQSAHVKQATEGFSVIASEIRKLADESKKFLSHIDVLAENIKHATDVTMTLAEDGSKTLQESIKLAQQVSKSFSSIMTINNGSFEGAEQVVLNVKQQVHAVQQVLGAMEIVNNVSQGTMAGMTQVRAELDKLNSFSETLKGMV